MEEVKGSDQPWIGLEKLPGEALHAVPDAHDIEAAPQGPVRPRAQTEQVDGEEEGHRRALVDLNRMARDAVAQINAPGQAGRHAIGAVGQASEQAAEPADHHAQREGADEDGPGRSTDSTHRLIDLHGHDRPDKGADNAVGNGGGWLAQGVERAGDEGASHRSQGQAGEVAAVHRPRYPLHGALDPPTVEDNAQRRPARPCGKVEGSVRPGCGRQMDHAGSKPAFGVADNLCNAH